MPDFTFLIFMYLFIILGAFLSTFVLKNMLKKYIEHKHKQQEDEWKAREERWGKLENKWKENDQDNQKDQTDPDQT